MPPVRVIYIDVLLSLAALSLLMDFLILWATSKAAKVPRKWWRLAFGALFGTAYFILYYLAIRRVVPYYGWLASWPALLIVSLSMLLIAFAPVSWPVFLRITAFSYFIAVSSGGAGLAAGYALGWDLPYQLLVAIGAIVVVAELGWGVVQKSIWRRLYHLPLEITLFDRRVRTIALLDTGNRLIDPLSGAAVVVVELEVLAAILPEPIREAVRQMGDGDLHQVSRLLYSSRWSSRFRVIPFRSLGRENGLLVGFRPDAAAIRYEGKLLPLDGVTIGIYHLPLDAEGSYHALLHPDAIEGKPVTLTPSSVAASPSKGEAPHATFF